MVKFFETLMALANRPAPKSFRAQARIVASRYEPRIATLYLLAVAREQETVR